MTNQNGGFRAGKAEGPHGIQFPWGPSSFLRVEKGAEASIALTFHARV